jgi:hypothetical protein
MNGQAIPPRVQHPPSGPHAGDACATNYPTPGRPLEDHLVMQQLFSRPAALVALAAAFLLSQASPAQAQGWGTIKGQVVFGETAIPKLVEANVDKDKEHCLSKGKIYTNDLIVNSKNKGVQYVLVYLQDLKDAKSTKFSPAIHPSYKNFKKEVEIDQPCCMFQPRMVALRVGQELVVKNSAPIAHNFQINSGPSGGPNLNLSIPAGGKINVKGFVSKVIPTQYNCTVHTWMKGYVASFGHPYFAVTDADGNFEIKNAPTGKYRLVFWHEKAGWVVMNPKNPSDRGERVTVEANKTVTLKPVKLTLPKD